MTARHAQKVEMIPIDRVTVVNPRIRSKKIFGEIVANIAEIGLKRPITVTRRLEAEGPFYDLVCGQGRLEAFRALGQSEVPALVVSADLEDCLIASLVENCARRQHRAIDLLQDIGAMKKRGYSDTEIATKTGLSYDYVHAVIRLLERGEERLLRAVEAGSIPITVAAEIAAADDAGVQRALQSAYEKNLLRGRKLLTAKRVVEQRKVQGKGLKSNQPRRRAAMSSDNLLKAYQEDAERKKMLIRRSEAARNRLLFIVQALRVLAKDETLLGLLEDEELSTMPEAIQTRITRLERVPA